MVYYLNNILRPKLITNRIAGQANIRLFDHPTMRLYIHNTLKLNPCQEGLQLGVDKSVGFPANSKGKICENAPEVRYSH